MDGACGIGGKHIALIVLLWLNAAFLWLAGATDYIKVDNEDYYDTWGIAGPETASIFSGSCSDSAATCVAIVGYWIASVAASFAFLCSIPWYNCCCGEKAEAFLKMATAILSTLTLVFATTAWLATLDFIGHGQFQEGFYFGALSFIVAIATTTLAWLVRK
jgi:hypothetical protein